MNNNIGGNGKGIIPTKEQLEARKNLENALRQVAYPATVGSVTGLGLSKFEVLSTEFAAAAMQNLQLSNLEQPDTIRRCATIGARMAEAMILQWSSLGQDRKKQIEELQA